MGLRENSGRDGGLKNPIGDPQYGVDCESRYKIALKAAGHHVFLCEQIFGHKCLSKVNLR